MDNYIGFSTLEFQYNKSFVKKNVDLVKQDLLNNIFTRRGERVMMFDYGTRIPDLLGDPLDETSLFIIEQDLTQVFANDPRVELLDLSVTPMYDENTVLVNAYLAYLYLDFNDRFDISIKFIDNN